LENKEKLDERILKEKRKNTIWKIITHPAEVILYIRHFRILKRKREKYRDEILSLIMAGTTQTDQIRQL
jgi:hypothetical protein